MHRLDVEMRRDHPLQRAPVEALVSGPVRRDLVEAVGRRVEGVLPAIFAVPPISDHRRPQVLDRDGGADLVRHGAIESVDLGATDMLDQHRDLVCGNMFEGFERDDQVDLVDQVEPVADDVPHGPKIGAVAETVAGDCA